MDHKKLDRMIARFALENGYTRETAVRRLLAKYIDLTSTLAKTLKSAINIVEQEVSENEVLTHDLKEVGKETLRWEHEPTR